MKTHKTKTYRFSLLSLVCFCLLTGCQRVEKESKTALPIENYPYLESEINELKIQFSKIENLIKDQSKGNKRIEIQDKSNEIKSITFRIGSKDDRIRIYWKDGRKTDLPCTKEQSIWACG